MRYWGNIRSQRAGGAVSLAGAVDDVVGPQATTCHVALMYLGASLKLSVVANKADIRSVACSVLITFCLHAT